MKKTMILLLIAMQCVAMRAAATFPTVSTSGNETWYYIQMQRGLAVLTSQGENKKLVTAVVNESKQDVQQWKVVASTANHYRLISRSGQTMYYNTSEQRFYTAASPSSGYADFQIVTTTNSGYQGFEIYVDQLGSGYAYMNQWGGAGAGKELGCYSKGDPNNPLQFVPANEMEFDDVQPDAVSEVSITGTTTWTPENKHTLWYTKPGTVWMTSALPIGNGQFGATVLGGVKRDEVQFNDKTLWRGQVGSVVDNGSYGSYLDFGHLYITTTDAAASTNYRRWLDIDEAVAGVAYTSNGVDYQREYIASYPDDVVAIKYTASQNGKINTQLVLYNANGTKPVYSINGTMGVGVFKGTAARTGTTNKPESFHCIMHVVTKGGNVTASADGITVSGADEMYVYLRGATNFDPSNDEYIYDATLLPGNVETIVSAASQKGYDAIRTDHIADYKALYDRCQLSLTTEDNTVTTPQLVSAFASNQTANLLLEEMYFAYGRYLLIGSSRGVTLPANLQGIWNNSNSPAWNSDIHSNINVQMNYWPAEVTNLSELHDAYLEYIYREACERPQWRRNATTYAGQTKGWTLTTENNIYGSGSNWMQNYTIANAWYCMHLWQHYRYTLDENFLRTKAMPAMKSCCEYWLERLVLATDGTYECPNEYSPEQGPGSENATAHSQQLVWDLFNSTLQALDVLGEDFVSASFLTDLKNKFEKLDKGTATEVVGGKTLLREWKYTSQANYDYTGHRHMSHLMGLYPGSQISEEADPEIYAAARNSVLMRGYSSTGWSMGWKINLNARIGNPDGCHTIITNALKLTTQTSNGQGGGIYENLWDAHPPFQIDGNLGATAGMAEMLLQSYTGKLQILPALPTSIWINGSVKGLRAVGNFEVDITWEKASATEIVVHSYSGLPVTIAYPNVARMFDVFDQNDNLVQSETNGTDEITFNTTAGGVYTLKYNGWAPFAKVEDITEGNYLLQHENGQFLQMTRKSNNAVSLTEDEKAEGAVWAIAPHSTDEYTPATGSVLLENEGNVYSIYNNKYSMYIYGPFRIASKLSAQALHPIYRDADTGLLAIRGTNIADNSDTNNCWYTTTDAGAGSTAASQVFCWTLKPVETDGIATLNFDKTTTHYYNIDGRAMPSVNQKGLYIRATERANGNIRHDKIIVK